MFLLLVTGIIYLCYYFVAPPWAEYLMKILYNQYKKTNYSLFL